ncbi:MAG: DNA polymerase I, partial [Nitrospirae bacterium]
LFCLGLSDGKDYLVVDFQENKGLFEVVSLRDVLEKLAERLKEGTQLVGFALKELIKEMLGAGQEVSGKLIDLKILYWLWKPQRGDDSLQEVALEVLGERFRDLKELLGRGRTIKDLPEEELTGFIAEELYLLSQLEDPLIKTIKQEDLWGLYEDMEMKLIEVLAEMERWGIKIQKERFQEALDEVDGQLKEIEKRIYEAAGERFNINSPRQLARVLFEKLGLKPKRKTKTGYSTDMNTLMELEGSHPVVGDILQWRTLTKMKNTYLEPILQKIDPGTGRLHTTFVQTGTATGRLSSREPNLQNIPVKGPLAQKIRDAFVAEEGFLLVSADYSQIELRVLAHLSGDEALMEAFHSGRDVHLETASKVFGIPEEEVTSEMRRMAKTVNFGIVYGISAFGLSEATGTGLNEAQEFIDRYFETFPKVREFAERMVQEAKLLGYVKSLFGRKRPVPELRSSVPHERAFGERVAINTPVQATAADIMKLAMIKVYEMIKENHLNIRMLLQVHDELLFEVPEKDAEEIVAQLKDAMERAVELSVPLVVDISWGRTWAEAHGE